MQNKVIWSEGLFLKPQHLQQQERYFEFLINAKTTALSNHEWGLSEFKLNHEMLTLGKISLETCRGIFADGTHFSAPGQDSLPVPLDIPAELHSSTVYLALPLQQPQQACIDLDPNQADCRYQARFVEINNNIAKSEAVCEARVAVLKPRLLLENDNRDSFTCIPVAKINEVRSNRMIIVDKKFMVPALTLEANPTLLQFILELHSLMQHRADMLADRLANSQQSASTEIADFMLLQLINRCEPLFMYFNNNPQLHPESLYLELIQLMGEIATFTQDNRRSISPPDYVHQQPNATFEPIINSLRQALCMVLEQNAHAITLTEHEYGVWTGNINNIELLEQANFVLAVYSSIGNDILHQQFAVQVKIAGPNHIKALVSRALPGIDIQPLAVAPRQIPYHANFSYFLLNRNHDYWEQVKSSQQIALHVGGNFPELKLELWAING